MYHEINDCSGSSINQPSLSFRLEPLRSVTNCKIKLVTVLFGRPLYLLLLQLKNFLQHKIFYTAFPTCKIFPNINIFYTTFPASLFFTFGWSSPTISNHNRSPKRGVLINGPIKDVPASEILDMSQYPHPKWSTLSRPKARLPRQMMHFGCALDFRRNFNEILIF